MYSQDLSNWNSIASTDLCNWQNLHGDNKSTKFLDASLYSLFSLYSVILSHTLSLSLTRPEQVPRSACQGHCLAHLRRSWSSSGVHGVPSNALNGPRRKLPLDQSKGLSDLTAPQDCDQTLTKRPLNLSLKISGDTRGHRPHWKLPPSPRMNCPNCRSETKSY